MKDHLFRRYGGILGTEIAPLSIFTARYFDKNYGETLREIPKNSKILEIGPGNASFIQYLLYKGYEDITACEMAQDNAQALSYALGDRVEVVQKDAISYLEGASDTFDLIHAGQVIEHFAYDDFVRFLEHCYHSLNSGGYVIFETINCANVTHGLYLRYCDYTHRMGFTPRSLKHFLMAIGDFPLLKLMEIRPPGLLDCLYYAYRKLRGNAVVSEIQQPASSTESRHPARAGRLTAILLKSLNIRFSRWVSFLLLRPYEFDGLKIYTPFFAVAAKKA